MGKMENFLNKARGPVKKSLIFGALIGGLTPNQKIEAQRVIDNFSRNETKKMELSISAQENAQIFNLIEKLEQKL